MSEFTEINEEQRLYVIRSGKNRISCLGFDVCEEWTTNFAKWLKIDPELPIKGTLEAYSRYLVVKDLVLRKCERENIRCLVHLKPQLIGLEKKRVKVVDTYGNIKRFWVGESTGPIPIHLEIARRNSSGGSAVYGDPFKSVEVLS